MVKWIKKTPEFGDHIKVSRGMYFHHGIYVSDECVIHFASESGVEISYENAVIHQTDLNAFSKENEIYVRVYNELENKNKRTSTEIVNYAFSRIGEKGYNLISNNCEHFANDCVFGHKASEQVEEIMSLLFGG